MFTQENPFLRKSW